MPIWSCSCTYIVPFIVGCMYWKRLVWLAVGFGVHTVSWKITNGGYVCALPTFLLLFIYCNWGEGILCVFRQMPKVLKANVAYVMHKERLSVALIVVYLIVKALLVVFYPEGEESNGSPVSLIFFTVLFITLFILPTFFVFIIRNVVGCSRQKLQFTKPDLEFVQWRRQAVICFCLVIISYCIDGDITALLRYFAKGQPCWPLLVPKEHQDSLPYPLKHAWLKTWKTVFRDYQPHWILIHMCRQGREMGEVCHLLPLLIGMYCLSQLFLSSKYSTIKRTLFACIAGVVLGGVTCGSLKLLFHRYRPNAYGNPYMWKGPGTTFVNHLKFSKLDLSFPAGHTTVVCATATCIYKALADDQQLTCTQKALLLVLIYFYPFLVLWSRVSDCYHWTSDTTFGVSYYSYTVYEPNVFGF